MRWDHITVERACGSENLDQIKDWITLLRNRMAAATVVRTTQHTDCLIHMSAEQLATMALRRFKMLHYVSIGGGGIGGGGIGGGGIGSGGEFRHSSTSSVRL